MRIVKLILYYAIIAICVYLSFKLSLFYMPFLIAFVISQLIEPIIKFVNKNTKLTRKSSSILVLVLFFILILILLGVCIALLVSETTNLLSSFNIYLEKAIKFVQNLDKNINIEISKDLENMIENIITDFINDFGKTAKSYLSYFLNGIKALPTFFIYIIITILGTYFICSDKFYILDQLEYHFPKKWVGKIRENTRKISHSLGSYFKAEVIMISISFIIVLIGLILFNTFGLDVEYPVTIAVITGFVDALPILRKWYNSCTLGNNITFK